MRTRAALGMHHHDGVTFQYTEGDQALFAVTVANVFARDREVVPNGLATGEVEAVSFNISPALCFVPSSHK